MIAIPGEALLNYLDAQKLSTTQLTKQMGECFTASFTVPRAWHARADRWLETNSRPNSTEFDLVLPYVREEIRDDFLQAWRKTNRAIEEDDRIARECQGLEAQLREIYDPQERADSDMVFIREMNAAAFKNKFVAAAVEAAWQEVRKTQRAQGDDVQSRLNFVRSTHEEAREAYSTAIDRYGIDMAQLLSRHQRHLVSLVPAEEWRQFNANPIQFIRGITSGAVIPSSQFTDLMLYTLEPDPKTAKPEILAAFEQLKSGEITNIAAAEMPPALSGIMPGSPSFAARELSPTGPTDLSTHRRI